MATMYIYIVTYAYISHSSLSMLTIEPDEIMQRLREYL